MLVMYFSVIGIYIVVRLHVPSLEVFVFYLEVKRWVKCNRLLPYPTVTSNQTTPPIYRQHLKGCR